ncbi:MAG: hypothetical protein ACO3FX_12150 [Gemmobacter sp.]
MQGERAKGGKTVQELFPGLEVFGTVPVEICNPWTGASCMLTPEELAVYDYLKGCERLGNVEGLCRAQKWFWKNNMKVYKTLLD